MSRDSLRITERDDLTATRACAFPIEFARSRRWRAVPSHRPLGCGRSGRAGQRAVKARSRRPADKPEECRSRDATRDSRALNPRASTSVLRIFRTSGDERRRILSRASWVQQASWTACRPTAFGRSRLPADVPWFAEVTALRSFAGAPFARGVSLRVAPW